MKFIALEGGDGAGKGTQTTLLAQRLQNEGHNVQVFDFPQYESFIGKEIGERLNGTATLSANELPVKDMSLWYAVDRAQAFKQLQSDVDIVLMNRSTYSNIAFQMARTSENEQAALKTWLEQLEFDVLQIPKPDLVLYLDVSVDISNKLVDAKGERGYTDKKRDVYESDNKLLQSVQGIYRELCVTEGNFVRIDCLNAQGLRSVSEIYEMIYRQVLNVIGDK